MDSRRNIRSFMFCLPSFPFSRGRRQLVEGLRALGASIRLARGHGKRSKEGKYFSARGDVACWWGERCLHFLDMITLG